MEEPTRIILADDHPPFRDGLVRDIERDDSFAIVGPERISKTPVTPECLYRESRTKNDIRPEPMQSTFWIPA
jgi:hypothetical protein